MVALQKSGSGWGSGDSETEVAEADATRETRPRVIFPRVGYTAFTELPRLPVPPTLQVLAHRSPPTLKLIVSTLLQFASFYQNALPIMHSQSARPESRPRARSLRHAPHAHTSTTSLITLNPFATVEPCSSSIASGWVFISNT